MFTKRHWASLAVVVCLAAVFVQSLPVADDKADEMSIASAMNMEEDLKPSTENPKEEPIILEEPKPKELVDTNHIQVIKMPSEEEVKEIIEELEEEIEREKEIEAEIKEEEMKEHEHMEKGEEIEKAETKSAIKDEPIVPMETAKVEEMPKVEEMTKVEEMPKEAETIIAVETPKDAETPNTETLKPMMERSPRNMQMEETSQQEKAPQESSLTDDDIDKIMKMISFPQTDEVMKTENGDTETKTEPEVEPRTTTAESLEEKTRVGRAIRSEGKGYYILAFSPIEGPLVPSYTKFDIIPIERSVDGDANIDDYDEDNKDPSEIDEGRLLTRKQFNHYIRKMMRQIRKGTRKIQRKTRLRSAVEEEPTVENFVRKWYATNKKAKAAASPQGSWFSWGQKA